MPRKITRTNRWETPMTSIAHPRDHVVSLARGMRDLVLAEAAESERMRTLTPAIVDEMWASGLMSAFNPAVVVRRGGLSARRRFCGGVYRPRQPGHHGRPVLPQRAGNSHRRRLSAERIVELRFRYRPLRVRRGRIPADGQRGDAVDQRRPPRDAGGRVATGTDQFQRRLVRTGAQGNWIL